MHDFLSWFIHDSDSIEATKTRELSDMEDYSRPYLASPDSLWDTPEIPGKVESMQKINMLMQNARSIELVSPGTNFSLSDGHIPSGESFTNRDTLVTNNTQISYASDKFKEVMVARKSLKRGIEKHKSIGGGSVSQPVSPKGHPSNKYEIYF